MVSHFFNPSKKFKRLWYNRSMANKNISKNKTIKSRIRKKTSDSTNVDFLALVICLLAALKWELSELVVYNLISLTVGVWLI